MAFPLCLPPVLARVASNEDRSASKRWPFSLLNDEQMGNWVGVKHLPVQLVFVALSIETRNIICWVASVQR